ncbi:MAG: penicillin-binding protein, partial [Chloroflexi bacterium]|nr:penicillin-binding protein [Chloroflexota bacterium]
ITGAGVVFTNCNLTSLKPAAIGQNSFVYAADGSLLGSIQTAQNRQVVDWNAISPWMPKAVVAIEDKRFYEHGGVDYVGIVRAAVADLRARKTVQGASTITQQLVRNLYISNRERTVSRKLKEVCLAHKLDQAYSKQDILTAYMNQVFYGSNAYGVEAAAETYFSKHASQLTLPQAALLAGLPQAPSDYAPSYNKPAALTRRNEVLKAMLDNKDISREQYKRAVATPIRLKSGEIYKNIREPYFFSYVTAQLVKQYGAETVRSGGLKVYTTINPRMQRLARKAIRGNLYYSNDPAAAIVAIDPRTGAIKAMTGVIPGKSNNQFNLAAQAKRQPGSTFKVFVLTAAIAQGMDPYSTYYTSAPFTYQPDSGSASFTFHTYSNTYAGSISVASATLRSDNTVYVQLGLDSGLQEVADMAYKLGGINIPADGVVPAMALGTAAVSPLQMASAYATLAAGGIRSEPLAITKVVLPDGTVDGSAGWGKPRHQRVIPDWVAYEVTKVLESNMTGGTAIGAYFGRVAAAKTGTTDDHADGWLCGYTPQLATAVWMGFPGGEIPMYSVHGVAVAGGNIPASIWHDFMAAAIASMPIRDFSTPTTATGFVTWYRGSYGYLGSTGTTATTTTAATTTAATTAATTRATTTQATTTRATTTRATTTHAATTETVQTQPATTTSAPPVTTTSEPPVTTTSIAPPPPSP